ncbi:unnamed protein product [Phaeothamnion confervicola]
MSFCPECSNILYPREMRSQKQLYYACNHCTFRRKAKEPCVYENNLVRTSDTKLDIVQDGVIDDPTLQRSFDTPCAVCGGTEAVFFQARTALGFYLFIKRRADDSLKSQSLSLIFVCCNKDCVHKWVS